MEPKELEYKLFNLAKKGQISFNVNYDEYDVVEDREAGNSFTLKESEWNDGEWDLINSKEEVVLSGQKEVLEPLLNEIMSTGPKEEVERFNIFIKLEDGEDAEPREKDLTYEECKSYCENIYSLYKEGKFDPWGYGPMNPIDRLLVVCYCSNGMTEDYFGISSEGNYAGQFVDYPDKDTIIESADRSLTGVCDCGSETKYTLKQLAERDGYDAEEIADFADLDPENDLCPNCYIGIRDEWKAWRNADNLKESKKSGKRVNEAITRKAKEKLNLLNDIVNFAYEYGEDETKTLFQQAFKKVTGDDLVDALQE